MNRQETLEYIGDNPEVSVLIIGAGINGISVFRDLTLQGVNALIVDRGDFCSGASAASSHMVHGGIRYLENGEFRLVREAVQERNRLIENAPHYVKPLPTVIPMFKWFSGLLNAPLKFFGLLNKPAERGALVIKAGMMMYDAFTRRQGTVPRHQFVFRKKSLQNFPRLNSNILCTATYYDGAMPTPERICIELLLDAEASSQAKAVNYVRTVAAAGDTVTLRDEITGKTLTVSPSIVINAAGPWIDFVNLTMGQRTRFIGGTKGSHLILDHPELREAIGEHEFFFENEDGRIVLVFPLLDKVLIGTSDIRIVDPDQARCTDEEVDYFISMLRKIFPSIQVERWHIVFRFSGVRPLPASDAAFSGQISRVHTTKVIEPGDGIDFPIYCLIGGKWTTFRSFSESVTNMILSRMDLTRKCGTEDLPIGGGKDYPHNEAVKQLWFSTIEERTGLPRVRLESLFERYGTRAEMIAGFISVEADTPLQHKPDYSRREIMFLADQEKIVHLDDLLLRRSLLAMLGELTPELITELAEVVGDALGWTPEIRQVEITRSLDILADRHGVVYKPPAS